MISPCIDCSTRHHACHDSCEDYKAWKAERDCKSEARRDALRRRYERPVQCKTRGRVLTHKK